MVGEIAGLCAAACWAVGSFLFSAIGKRTSPEAMNLGKCLAAGVLLSGTAILFGSGSWALGPAVVWLVLSAIAGLTIGDTAYFASLVRLGLSPALLLLSSAPAFTAVGGWLFLGEPLTSRDLAGIGAVSVGIAMVVWRPRSAGRKPGADRRLAEGVALGVLAAVCQASGSLLSKRAMVLGMTPLQTGGGRLLVGGLALGLFLGLRGRLAPTVLELEKDRAWLRIAGASLIGSYMGIWLAQVAIDAARSTGIAATLLGTSPIFALPISKLAGEKIEARAVVGALLGVLGVALLTLG